MGQHFILIDFENVQPTSLGQLRPGTCCIRLFLGQQQSKLPLQLTQALQPFGSDVEYLQMGGNGPNALDFHIAFYIGRLAATHVGAQFTIVSADAGFDPLIKHLSTLKIACRRVKRLGTSSINATPVASKKVSKPVFSVGPKLDETRSARLATVSVAPAQQRFGETVARLIGLKTARPASLKTLRSSIATWFKPKLNVAELDSLIEQLTLEGLITLTGNKVAYGLKLAVQK